MGSDHSDLQCGGPVQDRRQARLVGFAAPGSINKRCHSIYGVHQPGKELWQGGWVRCRTRTAYLHLFPDLGIRECPVPGELVRDDARLVALRDCGTSVHETAFALDHGALRQKRFIAPCTVHCLAAFALRSVVHEILVASRLQPHEEQVTSWIRPRTTAPTSRQA